MHSFDHRLSSEENDLLREAMGSAPIRLGPVAKALGIRVLLSTLPHGISGEIRSDEQGVVTIKINRHDSPARQRFTFAHELSHFFLHRDKLSSGIIDNVLYRSQSVGVREEAEANRLAADIIMPRELLRLELSKISNLDKDSKIAHMAKVFEVSKPAMEIRLEGYL